MPFRNLLLSSCAVLVVLARIDNVGSEPVGGEKRTSVKGGQMVSESVIVPRIRRDITIYRDEWGIPAVFASDNYDVFFGYGYAAAEDRLFQMEMSRRRSSGRMGEIVGERSVQSDKRARIFGARHRALRKTKALSAHFREILQGYASGINAYIETHDVGDRQGFRQLGFVPEPWTVEDIMTCGERGGDIDPHDQAWKLVEKVGVELTQELFPVWPADTPVIVPESEMAKNKKIYERLKNTPSVRRRQPAPASEHSLSGSNSCVVTGSKSATGKPILLADPQLGPPRIPQRLYEVVLHGGDFHCRGVASPGSPELIVGFNENLGWTITGLGGNRADLFEEKLHPSNPDFYMFRGRWEPVEKRTETIKVKGGEDVTVEVRSTHHGVISGELFGEEEKVLALQHAAFEGNDSRVLDFLRINAARDYREFRDAVSKWDAGTAHLIYADRTGNIAYWPAGAFPLRSKGFFWGPIPGWTGEYEWDGFVPFDEKPSLLNPDQDFIVAANNLMVGEWYPYQLMTRAGSGTRFQRIREIIMGGGKFSLKDIQKVVRADITCSPEVRKMVPLILGLVAKAQDVPAEVQEAADRLDKWDYRFAADSVASTIFDRFVGSLKETVFRPRLGDEFGLGTPGWEIAHLRPDSSWFDDPATPEVEARDDIFYAAFRRIVGELTEELGPDQEKWIWGDVSFTEIHHQLAEMVPEHGLKLPDLGKFVMEGRRALTPHILTVVSYSQIVDLADLDNSRAMLAVGNSELYDSPHCYDQIELWRDFELRPAYLSEAKIVSAAKSKLLLHKTSPRQ